MISPTGHVRLAIRGAVQGVGFRPFVYRVARSLQLRGWVENSAQGVTIEAEGPDDRLLELSRRLIADKPPRALVHGIESTRLEPTGLGAFTIRESEASGERAALVLPDIGTCAECLRETLDSRDRRYRYPFTNCTNCGPRYSIVLDLPYDRAHTTMARFEMCRRCRAEYDDPADRRFHAEPIACPECGPRLELRDGAGHRLAHGDDALRTAANAVRSGRIVALKGLGGFHLVVDARHEETVRELRRRKRREAKPFAVMLPSLADARRHAELEPGEEALLLSPESPIVICRRRNARQDSALAPIAEGVAPGNPCLGLLLPYTPLHHLFLAELGFPVVATSGNSSDEPICIDEDEAAERLAGIADLFLVHDRPIARPLDDSVARLIAGRPMLIRRARGYAPLPVGRLDCLRPILAVGGHLKNTVAISAAGQLFLGPHGGDLETEPAYRAFRGTVEMLGRLYAHRPEAIACDAHPDYASTQWARRDGRPTVEVQHHHAHVLAGMTDNALEPPVLGIAWDGSGYGMDGTIWGGEALRVAARGFTRVASMRLFPLPGGEKAVREPRRSALGALYALRGEALLADDGDPVWWLFSAKERPPLKAMLSSGLNSPLTSSAGRLFDAVAALAGLHPVSRFEGQAAMALEFALDGHTGDAMYPFEAREEKGVLVLDWGPALEAAVRDARAGRDAGWISLRVHNALVEMILAAALHAGEERVVLTGGCFQNRYLSERAIARLRDAGFKPYWHERIPPNDGGIAVGQLRAAAQALQAE